MDAAVRENYYSIRDLITKWRDENVLAYQPYLGDLPRVSRLVQAGADIDEGMPLAWAAASGKYDVVRFLVEEGADINYGGPVVQAVGNAHWEIVYQALDINDPSNPVHLGYRKDRSRVGDIAVSNGSLFVAARDSGLRIFDLENRR